MTFKNSLLALATALCCVTALAAEPPKARELVALPDGGWLALDKTGLRLIDGSGSERARWPVRGESLDARVAPDGSGVAIVIDSNAEAVVPLALDLRAYTLQARTPLPSGRSIATACLYRDAQGHVQVFVIGDNGIARQWVLRGDEALPVRELAVEPEAEHCRVDDAHQRLFVSEPGGVWARRAEAEGDAQRAAVALRRPLGPLRHGSGPITVLPGGVTVGDGARLLTFAEHGGRWSAHRAPLTQVAAAAKPLPVVMPRVQTAPVAQFGDAADDPAIWIDARDPINSRVLATDKKRGLAVHDLQGAQRQFLAVGRVNNVDVRHDVQLGGERIDLAAASQRDERAVLLFRIAADGTVSELARVPTGLDEVYGLCMRRTSAAEAEVFVNDKDGRMLQLRIARDAGGAVTGQRLREFRFATQPEGCVVDDATNRLFAGEEKRGLWAMSAEPGDARASDRKLVLPVGGVLTADVEGMAIHRTSRSAWLVVSSQGSDSYVVLDAAPPHRVRGAFRIGMNLEAGIDGASETDGLDVTSVSLGPQFPRGMLVVHDGHKVLPDGPQNFKYVSWEDVARALGLD